MKLHGFAVKYCRTLAGFITDIHENIQFVHTCKSLKITQLRYDSYAISLDFDAVKIKMFR